MRCRRRRFGVNSLALWKRAGVRVLALLIQTAHNLGTLTLTLSQGERGPNFSASSRRARTANTKSATCSSASSMQTPSTNTNPSSAKRSSAARRGWADFPIGIVANQRHRVRPADGPYQFGGVLYVDSAEKAARFVMNCNQDWLPILFLQDVNGFMVGRDAERSGIIKAGAKLVSAISNSRVPKITLITGGSYGAGNYALCGKAFDPRFIFAWPTAHVAVMGADQAADTLLDVAVKSLQRQGDQSRRRGTGKTSRHGDQPTISVKPMSATPPRAAGSMPFSIRPRLAKL